MSLRKDGESIYAAAVRIAAEEATKECEEHIVQKPLAVDPAAFEAELIKVRGLSVEQKISELLKESL